MSTSLRHTLLTEPLGNYPRRVSLWKTARHWVYPHNPASYVYDPVTGQQVLVPDRFQNPGVPNGGYQANVQGYVNDGLQLGTTSGASYANPNIRLTSGINQTCAPAGGGVPPPSAVTSVGACPATCTSTCPASSPPPPYSQAPPVPPAPPSSQAGPSQACPSGVACPSGCTSSVPAGPITAIGTLIGRLLGTPCCSSTCSSSQAPTSRGCHCP